jgi:medium-chain acyl-[acyl-carrier-protein] hydrolase
MTAQRAGALTSPHADDRWIIRTRERSHAQVRLFCLPYAGSGASVFRGWDAGLPDGIDVAAVQLPGRQGRYGEPLRERMDDLVDDLADAISRWLDRPYALFGHSMGARISCALAHRLRLDGHPRPVRLFASASPGPVLRLPVGTDDPSDEGVVSWLRYLGGTPDEVLSNPDLLELVLPVIRADVEIVRSWGEASRQPLDCPIRAFAASGDRYATPQRVRAWECETASRFSLTVVPGGHIFLRERAWTLFRTITNDLRSDGALR